MDIEKAKANLEARGFDKPFENSAPEIIEISREDFDLLDVEKEVIYHIVEEDGTITIRKGENK